MYKPEIAPALCHDVVQPPRQLLGQLPQVGQPQGAPQLPLPVLGERVQVEPERAGEQHWVLSYKMSQ